ncbi:MAG TPA: hypothetical protein VG248_13880 [Caulobacteraceae bacterium]|jgi:hypothetical protein|nr:hypothetical protein [Caulobacteraceae bacterium]
MFTPWQTFFQLTGSSSAALIGLLFVVVSFTTRRAGQDVSAGVRLFMTPTVFVLAMVLAISAVALAPPALPATALILAGGVWTLAYSAGVALRLFRFEGVSHWSDIWFYGFIPMLLALGLAGAALLAWMGERRGVTVLAVLLLCLLGVAIRNGWDLVTWLAPRRPES